MKAFAFARPALSRPGGRTVLMAGLACAMAAAIMSNRGSAQPTPLVVASTGYREAAAALDQRIATLQVRAERMSNSWMAGEWLALAFLDRAQLTGDYADYARARAAVDRACAIAPAGAGPLETRAQIAFSTHCFAGIVADLDVCEGATAIKDSERAALWSMRANVAYQQGDFAGAETAFHRSLALARRWTTMAAQAQLLATTGDPDGADRTYQAAQAMTALAAPRQRAWLHLQRGLLALARGRHADAEAQYRQADAAFPGWWLIEEHLAEIAALRGRREEARTRYAELVARTGNPEFMDALAHILRSQGDEAGANDLLSRATASFERLIVDHPEAATGHALRHFLDHDKRPEVALRLAQGNYALRPGGEATTLLIRAHLAQGDVAAASVWARRLIATRWDTAEGHAAAAVALERSGDHAAARVQSERARDLDPTIDIEPQLVD